MRAGEPLLAEKRLSALLSPFRARSDHAHAALRLLPAHEAEHDHADAEHQVQPVVGGVERDEVGARCPGR